MSRVIATLLLLGLLAGCASTAQRECQDLAGPGWKIRTAPPEGKMLLRRLNLPDDADVVWLGHGSDKLMVCDHGFGLVNPACNGSTGYQYDRVNGQWAARGVSLPACTRDDQ